MRKDIEFPATDGTILRGWHYLPDGRPGKHPTIVMAHGFSAVKEMYLDKYAESFARAGFASVVYDNRNFGASDGLPRQEIDPWLQIRDYSDAITFAQCLSETDAERIGVWGSSYSGGHVLVVAAIDRRVKCVVSQVPAISGSQGFRRLVRADFLAGLNAQFAEDRRNRAAGKPPAMVPVIDENPAAVSALPTPDSYKWFSETHKSRGPSWRNEITLRTLEYGFGYEPGAYIGNISPTPLLLIIALKDHLAVSDLAIKAYEQAYEPKKLVLLPGGHFDAYVEEFDQSCQSACEWFATHLMPAKR
jgi:cephalosporin-C deacetylase-like acetyl esterase